MKRPTGTKRDLGSGSRGDNEKQRMMVQEAQKKHIHDCREDGDVEREE